MPIHPKELAQLAAACRKAGITHFKQGDLEFTLDPTKSPKAASAARKQTTDPADPVSEGELTSDALLFWSTQEIPVPETKEGAA